MRARPLVGIGQTVSGFFAAALRRQRLEFPPNYLAVKPSSRLAHIWDSYAIGSPAVSIFYAPLGKCALPAMAKRPRNLTGIKVAYAAT
jgi:hypothetical protein